MQGTEAGSPMLMSSMVDCLKRFKSGDEVDEVTQLLQSWIAQNKENVPVCCCCSASMFDLLHCSLV